MEAKKEVKEILLDTLMYHKNELQKYIAQEKELASNESVADGKRLSELRELRLSVSDKIKTCAYSLVDMGARFGARKIRARQTITKRVK